MTGPEKLPGRHVPVDRRGVGRIEMGHRRLQLRQEGLDQIRGRRPDGAQVVAPRPRFSDEHLRSRGLLRNERRAMQVRDRKSTRLNSSHLVISYAVFCLKKKIIYLYQDTIQSIVNPDLRSVS